MLPAALLWHTPRWTFLAMSLQIECHAEQYEHVEAGPDPVVRSHSCDCLTSLPWLSVHPSMCHPRSGPGRSHSILRSPPSVVWFSRSHASACTIESGGGGEKERVVDDACGSGHWALVPWQGGAVAEDDAYQVWSIREMQTTDWGEPSLGAESGWRVRRAGGAPGCGAAGSAPPAPFNTSNPQSQPSFLPYPTYPQGIHTQRGFFLPSPSCSTSFSPLHLKHPFFPSLDSIASHHIPVSPPPLLQPCSHPPT